MTTAELREADGLIAEVVQDLRLQKGPESDVERFQRLYEKALRALLTEQRRTRAGIPRQVQDGRTVVKLYAVAHEHDPALCPQPLTLALVVVGRSAGQRHEVPEDPADMPLVDRDPLRGQVASDRRQRVPQPQVSLSHAHGDIQTEGAVRKGQAQILRSVEDRLRAGAVIDPALLVPSNDVDVSVQALNPPRAMLADVQLRAAHQALLLDGRDDQ
ncbi:MAG: hypothetical protein HYY16_04830 [Planctomycetes bacterium]|nr:hypothetical protein [Planctomycetota bacterium]